MAWLVAGGIVLHWGRTWLLDLRVYRDAGHLLFAGGDPYRATFTEHALPFTYPPFALLVLSPLSFGPLRLVEIGWWLTNAVALVAVIALALRESGLLRGRRAFAVAALLGGLAVLVLEPVRSNMDFGQINVLLMLLVVFDLTRLRSPWRGALVGVAAAVKLTPLVYLLFFVVRREWLSLARGVSTFAVTMAVAWLVLPAESARYWSHLVFDPSRTGDLAGVSNQSWRGLLARLPIHSGSAVTASWGVLVIVTVMTTVALVGRLLDGDRVLEAVIALALCELLISPVSWTHHWSWLAIAPSVVVILWRRQCAIAVLLVVLVVLAVVAPYWWVHHGPLSFPAANALTLAGAAVLFFWAGAELRRGAKHSGTSEVVRQT